MPKSRVIIILGKKLDYDEMVPELIERLEKAISIIRKNDIIIISGGKVDENSYHTEAFLMKQYLKRRGVTNEIISEDKSTTTYHNIKYLNQIIDNDPRLIPLGKIVVSSGDHHPKIHKFLGAKYFNNLDWKVHG